MFATRKEMKKYQFAPYEDCPCESGKKYKFCCYAKSKNEKNTDIRVYNAKRFTAEGKKQFRDTDFKLCFGFDKSECSSDVIGAHSIQNNGVLNTISENNHVYVLESEIGQNSMLPQLNFVRVGKNKASTFSGFCKKHDEQYFKCIEDTDYVASNEQNYWFAFRAFAFEYHRKIRLKKSYALLFQKYASATKVPEIYSQYYSTELSIRDSLKEYERFKEIYEDKSFDKLDTFVKEVPFKVGFAATTAVAVGEDMKGNMAADIYNYDEKIFIPSICISVIPRENSTLIILTRFKEDTCYEELFSQLKNNLIDEKLFKYITFCLAEYSENVYFSPSLINSLNEELKNEIKKAFMGVANTLPVLRLENMLATLNLNLFDSNFRVK